jgi:hypothetical protein
MVFISYSTRDEDAKTFAQSLYSALTKAEVPCFLSGQELHGGHSWPRVLRAYVSRSKVFVPVISPKYLLDSAWCLAELHIAMQHLVADEDVEAGATAVAAVIKSPGFSLDGLRRPTAEQAEQRHTAWAAKKFAKQLAAAVGEPTADAARWPAADLEHLLAQWQVEEIEEDQAKAKPCKCTLFCRTVFVFKDSSTEESALAKFATLIKAQHH